MGGDPNEPGRISVTLKQDGKDGTWLVMHGSPAEVRAQIAEVFDLNEEQSDGPLFDLINEATRLYKAAGNVSSGLGGRVVGGSNGSARSGSGSAWAQAAGNGAEAEPEADPNIARVEAGIEAATTRDGLREFYARNEAVFKANPELVDAYKAKGKSLS